MRSAILLLAAAIVVELAALLIRVQPAGSATIFRSGRRVVVRTTPIYVRAIGAVPCRVKRAGDRLSFDDDEPSTSASNDEFSLHVRFSYLVPPFLPAEWPAGDWCQSLHARVRAIAGRASMRTSVADLLDRRRETSDRIGDAIAQELRSAGMQTNDLSARVDLPAGFNRLRPIAAVVARVRKTKPVIFIGLDGADWSLLDPYMASGAMPNLKRLVSTGLRGTLETELPPLSPLVWTTMMTGVSPLQHQILDFTRFNPTTHEKEPITSDERRVPAIWSMLTYGGKQAAVFGLWATYAAEPVHAINVSDRLFTFLYSDSERPPGVVYPPQRQRWAEQQAAAAEGAIDIAQMREYLPSITDADFAALSKVANPYSEPAAALRRILVNTEIYRRLSIDFLRSRSRLPDLTIVYFEGTDTIGHVFAPFAPPRQPQILQADYDRYSGVPEKYFRHIDSILGEYLTIAERGGAAIFIASDHGFRWTEGRPTEMSSTATATAAKWHRNQGIWVVWGSPLAEKPTRIRQVCATLRALTGMPELDYSRYFQPAAPPPPPASPRASDEDLAKLRALGYIGSNESARSAAPDKDTKTAGAYNNMGLILRQEHRIDEAVAAFERAMAIDPHYASAQWNLSETLFDAKRDLDRADALLVSAMQDGLPDATRSIIVRAIAYGRSSHTDRSLKLLDGAVSTAPSDAELRIFRGRYRMDRHDCGAALEDFRRAEAERPDDAIAFASAGLAQMCIGDSAGAQESFARARQLDPKMPLPR
jgi:Tfp pilus assembly protein PilF